MEETEIAREDLVTMGAVRKKNVAKIETTYVKQQETVGIAAARKKKILYRRLTIFFVFALFISYFMVSSIVSQASSLNAESAQKSKLAKQLADLRNEQKSLKDDISKLNNDDYIAKLAREKYFLSNKDEVIFNLPEDKKEKQP